MKTYRTIIAAALAVGFAASVQAAGLNPIAAQSIDLGSVSGVAYYTVERDGFHVVATLGGKAEGETPLRVEAVLANGQSVILSTPRGPGVAADAVEISRRDDEVLVHKAGLEY